MRYFLLAALLLLMSVAAQAQAVFFVATNGSDSNPGTFSAPFATLPKCQAAMEAASGPGKTCFIRAGTYQPTPSSTTTPGCNNGNGGPPPPPANIVQLTHAKGDDGEVWSYYPPDGLGNAVIDGSSSSSTTGIPTAFCVYHVKNVTVTGLTFRHFRISPLVDANWDANDGNGVSNIFSANTVQNSNFIGAGNPGINFSGWVESGVAFNNLVQNVQGQGIGAFTAQASTAGGLSGLTIQNNAILTSCTALSDCGGIYIQDYQNPRSSGMRVVNNYIYQVDIGGSGGKGVYLDDGTSNVTARSNVIVAGGALFTCAQIHGGSNDVFQDNVCDIGSGTNSDILFYQQSTTAPGSMTGNAWRGNTIVCFASNNCGNGYVGSNLSGQPVADTNSNLYWNYGGVSTVNTAGSNGAAADANPIAVNAGLTCWGLGLNFGPPGFQIPQGGTPPSWPHGC